MNEQLWTVVRFPDGSWSYGGKPDDPAYAQCEKWRLLAGDGKQAVNRAQGRRRRTLSSRLQAIYEKLCPDDVLDAEDPRRQDIIAEMQLVMEGPTEKQAADVIAWWNCWPNPQHQSAIEFVQEARKLFLRVNDGSSLNA